MVWWKINLKRSAPGKPREPLGTIKTQAKPYGSWYTFRTLCTASLSYHFTKKKACFLLLQLLCWFESIDYLPQHLKCLMCNPCKAVIITGLSWSVQRQGKISPILVEVPRFGFDEGHVHNDFKGEQRPITGILVIKLLVL